MSAQTSAKLPRISDLSFVHDMPKAKRGGTVKTKPRCFRHVRSTGDRRNDEELGYRFALEYLAHEEADFGGAGKLQLIVQDMPRKLGAMEIAFLTLISYAAGAGAHEARRVATYWERWRA